MRWVLSWSFWVPFAMLSYSMYIVSVDVIFVIPDIDFFKSSTLKPLNGTNTPDWNTCATIMAESTGKYILYFFMVLIPTMLYATCCFTCIEKPGIDARVVFKNKFEIEKINKKRIDYLKRYGQQTFASSMFN